MKITIPVIIEDIYYFKDHADIKINSSMRRNI